MESKSMSSKAWLALAGAMGGGMPVFSHHHSSQSRNFPAPKPGDKLRKKVRQGVLTMQHPGGVVSAEFRARARRKNKQRFKAQRGVRRAGHPVE